MCTHYRSPKWIIYIDGLLCYAFHNLQIDRKDIENEKADNSRDGIMKTGKLSIEYLDHMGEDLSVANAARVSFYKFVHAFSGREERLLKYLAKHGHWSPFGHVIISLRITVPIAIMRQIEKHQVGGCKNEVSFRYVDDEPTFYIPSVYRGRAESAKQGSSREQIRIEDMDIECVRHCLQTYTAFINKGMCPEQARFFLPACVFTSAIVTGSLYFFARLFNLRADPHAQKETRAVAYMIGRICRNLFPVSWRELTKKQPYEKIHKIVNELLKRKRFKQLFPDVWEELKEVV